MNYQFTAVSGAALAFAALLYCSWLCNRHNWFFTNINLLEVIFSNLKKNIHIKKIQKKTLLKVKQKIDIKMSEKFKILSSYIRFVEETPDVSFYIQRIIFQNTS